MAFSCIAQNGFNIYGGTQQQNLGNPTRELIMNQQFLGKI